MNKTRLRGIAIHGAAIVTTATVVRVSHGLLKSAVGHLIINRWGQFAPSDYHPGFTFTLLINLVVDSLTSLPGAALSVILTRVLLQGRTLPTACLSALLVLVLDKRFRYALQNQHDEKFSVLLLSAFMAPLVLVAISYVADFVRRPAGKVPETNGRSPNQAL